ncbi:ABC transporter permease [Cellvibrio mixtus]|uniref:ABC transporter permease n=1 Tax=Cellvibrio mixtus TaxID=39650 RepID=UPI0013632988|nr:ABC transporter permease [Cellvibrio mixtus]
MLKLPMLLFRSLWVHRSITILLASRELTTRFTGSLFGRLWLIISPLVLLAVYAFFFGEILQAKWSVGNAGDGLTSFALVIFSGLILHQFFADCISRAPELMLINPNYVKKIVFPLEILPVVTLLAAIVQLLISTLILIIVFGLVDHTVYWKWLFLPVVYIPFFITTLGIMWVLSALGVFLRDLRQLMQFMATVTLFLSPVFYPMDRLPESMQFLNFVNPLVVVIEQARIIIFEGKYPDWMLLAEYSVISFVIALVGFYCFQRSKPAFADVI